MEGGDAGRRKSQVVGMSVRFPARKRRKKGRASEQTSPLCHYDDDGRAAAVSTVVVDVVGHAHFLSKSRIFAGARCPPPPPRSPPPASAGVQPEATALSADAAEEVRGIMLTIRK